MANDAIAARLDTPRQIVSKWRRRFHLQRLAGLEEQPLGIACPPVKRGCGGLHANLIADMLPCRHVAIRLQESFFPTACQS
jgi:hypothetical protein